MSFLQTKVGHIFYVIVSVLVMKLLKLLIKVKLRIFMIFNQYEFFLGNEIYLIAVKILDRLFKMSLASI